MSAVGFSSLRLGVANVRFPPIADIATVVQPVAVSKESPDRDKRNLLQKNSTAVGIALVLGFSFFTGGPLGLMAAAVVLLVLAFVLGLIVTCIQSFRPFDPASSLSTSGGRITGPLPFHRRLWRNFLVGLEDLPSFWG